MILLSKTLPSNHDIILAGDFHRGSLLCFDEGLNQLRDQVLSSSNTYLMIGGDLAEGILIDDKRFNWEVDKGESALKQYQWVRDYLKPIVKAGKIISCNFGNHDWKLSRFGNYVRDLVCSDLDQEFGLGSCPYGTFSCKVSISDEWGKLYKIFYTHGSRSINSISPDPIRKLANMKFILKRHLQDAHGDCLVMAKAHSHKLLITEPETSLYLWDDGKRIKSSYTGASNHQNYIPVDIRWYINSGSFYRLYADTEEDGPVSSYAEMAEYAPNELGYVVIECREGKVSNVRKVVVG